MQKLNQYFMEGQNNGIWRNPEKLVEFVLIGFRCATISLAVVEKAGGIPRSIICTLAPLGRK